MALLDIDKYREYPTKDDDLSSLKIGDRIKLNDTVANIGDVGLFLEIKNIVNGKASFELKSCDLI